MGLGHAAHDRQAQAPAAAAALALTVQALEGLEHGLALLRWHPGPVVVHRHEDPAAFDPGGELDARAGMPGRIAHPVAQGIRQQARVELHRAWQGPAGAQGLALQQGRQSPQLLVQQGRQVARYRCGGHGAHVQARQCQARVDQRLEFVDVPFTGGHGVGAPGGIVFVHQRVQGKAQARQGRAQLMRDRAGQLALGRQRPGQALQGGAHAAAHSGEQAAVQRRHGAVETPGAQRIGRALQRAQVAPRGAQQHPGAQPHGAGQRQGSGQLQPQLPWQVQPVLGVPVRVQRAQHQHLFGRQSGSWRGLRRASRQGRHHAPVEPRHQQLAGRQPGTFLRRETLGRRQGHRVGKALVQFAHPLGAGGVVQGSQLVLQHQHGAAHEAAHVVVRHLFHRQGHQGLHQQQHRHHRQGQPCGHAGDAGTGGAWGTAGSGRRSAC